MVMNSFMREAVDENDDDDDDDDDNDDNDNDDDDDDLFTDMLRYIEDFPKLAAPSFASDEDAGQKVPSHRDSSAKPVQSCEAYFGTVEFLQKGLNHSSRLRPIRIREVYFNTVAPYC
uniref:Uncharacterized protein n=1 Tax=Vespula pensylvanica TaxID=30213 RepID=A0A834PDD3_VESPE|nr:hypothetical protein H0235_000045 [Vespula pensylvanica]